MTNDPIRPAHRRLSVLIVLAALALCASLAPGSAVAAPGSGEATLSLRPGAESSLLRQGVKVTYSAKAGKTGSAKRLARKGKGGAAQTVAIAIDDVVLGSPAVLGSPGVLTFAKGGDQVTVSDLEVRVAKFTTVYGKLGKEWLTVFRAEGTPTSDSSSVKLDGAKLSLTGKAARELRDRFDNDRISAGRIGSAAASAKVDVAPSTPTPTPTDPGKKIDDEGLKNLDPYFAQCAVAATSQTTGALPAPPSLPSLASAKDTVAPAQVTWGFRQSFRSYVVFGAGGSLQGLDGASTNGGPPVISSFNFPATEGEYASNNPVDMTDDQAVVESKGKALFCAKAHEFRVVISDPTVVIDGANSRIEAGVDTNLTGVWTPSQRIRLANLNLNGITPFYNHSGSEVNWGSIPATLTADGAAAICGTSGQPACSYKAGDSIDSIDVAVKTPYDTGAGDAAAWTALANYVSAELPFPIPLATEGGCTLPGSAGGTAGAARTIDEHVALGGTTSAWNPDGAQPAALPDLTGKTTLTGGRFDWGFRRSLRGSVNGTGDFNLAGGATASDVYYGNGGTAVARPGLMSNTVGSPSKFFRWPFSSGKYDAGAAGTADDRLVLQTQGRVAFCQVQSAQQYGVVFSNPAIVIDGTKSRVTIDVATRYRLSWVRGRVDIATLDLADPGTTITVTPGAGSTTVEWKFADANETPDPDVGPVKLTKAGEAVVNMVSKTGYIEGLGLDGAAIQATFAS